MSALVNKKRDSELRNAAKAFVTSFYGAVATSDEEVRRIFQRPGWSLFHGGIVELTDEVTTALSRLAARAAKLLGPSGGNEKATRELALKEAQNSFTNKVPVEDAVTRLIDKIFDQGTAQFDFLVPNYLLLFGDNIRSIEIGRVRAAFTAELATEFAERAPNQRFRVIPGQSFSLQFVGDVVHVEMFPIAWLVSVSAAKENVEEEAKWLIDVALSFLRLHYKQEGARFPTNGAIEPHPLRLKNIDNVGVKIQGTTAHLGGGSVPPAYEITAEIQAIAADPAFQDKARLIFDPPEKSVAARVSRGLGG